MTKIEFPQVVVRSGWYGVCPGDCFCPNARPPLTDENREYPSGGQYWEVQVIYEGSPVATLKYRDTWCPLHLDYVTLSGMDIDDDGVNITLKFNISMEGALGGPQILFPAFGQLFYSNKEKRWKMGIVKEYNVVCERKEPPCCLPHSIEWQIGEAALSDYGYVEIVKGDDPTEVQLNIKFAEVDDSKLTCSCENFYTCYPYGCESLVSCESASFAKHPDWVSNNYFGAFTTLSIKSCWNSQIYKVNVKTGQGSVDTISNELKVTGEPLVPRQCWPSLALAGAGLLGVAFILHHLG